MRARQEPEWRATQRDPLLGPVLLEKAEASPEESQDMRALQKELEQVAKLLKQKRITLGYTQACVGAHPGRSLWKGDQSDNHQLL